MVTLAHDEILLVQTVSTEEAFRRALRTDGADGADGIAARPDLAAWSAPTVRRPPDEDSERPARDAHADSNDGSTTRVWSSDALLPARRRNLLSPNLAPSGSITVHCGGTSLTVDVSETYFPAMA